MPLPGPCGPEPETPARCVNTFPYRGRGRLTGKGVLSRQDRRDPCGYQTAPRTDPARSVPGSLYTLQCLKRV